MRRHITVAVIAGVLGTTGLAAGQVVEPVAFRKEVAASGVLMLPRGDFRRALQTVPYGGGVHGLFPIRSGRVSIGVDSQLLLYEERSPWRNNEMILTAHGLVRWCGRNSARRPYAEALGGIKGFSIDTTHIGTSSYGVGAGVQFSLRPTTVNAKAAQEVWEIGVRYLRGGAALVDDERFASSSHSMMLHVGWGLRF